MNTIINHGFVIPKLDDTQYLAGSLPKIVLNKNGQWVDSVPIIEFQFNGKFESFGCTIFNTLNCRETLKKKIDGKEENYSDRFSYVSAEVTPPGADPHVVADVIRNVGVIKESSLPFRKDITDLNSFRSFEGKDKEFSIEAKKSLSEWDFKHEWVFNTRIPLVEKQKRMMEYLQYSPLGVSVRAWQQRNGFYYKNVGESDTHWCCLVGYVEGKYWIVYDSYPDVVGSVFKYLEWDYDFNFCKRYHLEKMENKKKEFSFPVACRDIFSRLFGSFKLGSQIFTKDLERGSFGPEVFKLQYFLCELGYGDFALTGFFGDKTFEALKEFQKDNKVQGTGYFGPITKKIINECGFNSDRETIYKTAMNLLGIDVTPEDKVPDEYGCAEAVCAILKKSGFDIGNFPLTTNLYYELQKREDWREVSNPIRGDLILSPTGLGGAKKTGHVGIVGKNQKIMSNSSSTGLFVENYTIFSWKKSYNIEGQLPIYYFRKIK